MRVLVSTTANDGHAGPVFSFARACLAAGHAVAVAAPASYAAPVQRAGFEHLPFDDSPPEQVGPLMGRLPELEFEEANAVVIREVFARIDAQAALPGVTAAIEDWQPDLVLREPAEFGSLTASVRAGVPHAQVTIGVQEMTRLFLDLVEEPLAELGHAAGVDQGRLSHALHHEPALSLVPESFDRAGDAGYLEELPVERFRDASPSAAPSADLPAWGDPEHPLVYVTFGSVTGSLPPFAGVFRTAIDALADDDVRVLLTVGRRVDPSDLAPLPGNAHVVQWWPQDDVLAHAAAVLGHGGFGTTYGALVHGVPQVLAPLFSSDQRINGVHVQALGVGRTVPPGREDVVERAVVQLRTVLEDPECARRAEAVSAETADLPLPGAAVSSLERLAE